MHVYMVCIKVQSSYLSWTHMSIRLQQQIPTQYIRDMHLTAVHEYTNVACCYHVSRGEQVILGVVKNRQ